MLSTTLYAVSQKNLPPPPTCVTSFMNVPSPYNEWWKQVWFMIVQFGNSCCVKIHIHMLQLYGVFLHNNSHLKSWAPNLDAVQKPGWNSRTIAIWILYTKKSQIQMFSVYRCTVFRPWLYSVSTSPQALFCPCFICTYHLVLLGFYFPFAFRKKLKPIFSFFLQ